jgi:hypothetical protein
VSRDIGRVYPGSTHAYRARSPACRARSPACRARSPACHATSPGYTRGVHTSITRDRRCVARHRQRVARHRPAHRVASPGLLGEYTGASRDMAGASRNIVSVCQALPAGSQQEVGHTYTGSRSPADACVTPVTVTAKRCSPQQHHIHCPPDKMSASNYPARSRRLAAFAAELAERIERPLSPKTGAASGQAPDHCQQATTR